MPKDRKPQRPLSNRDLEVFIQHYRGDLTMTEAAEAIGYHAGTVFRAVRDNPEMKAALLEARELKKQRRAERSVQVIEQVRDDPEHKDRLRAAVTLAQVYDEDFRAAKSESRLEVTGGEPIRVEVESTDDEAARVLHVLAGAGLLALRAQGDAHPTLDSVHPAPLD